MMQMYNATMQPICTANNLTYFYEYTQRRSEKMMFYARRDVIPFDGYLRRAIMREWLMVDRVEFR